MSGSNINIGSLIRYSDIEDGEVIYGIVLGVHDDHHQVPAVKVRWFDDRYPEATFESVSRLVSNKEADRDMEIISGR